MIGRIKRSLPASALSRVWLRGGILSGLMQALGMVAIVVTQFLLARSLAASEFGQYMYAFSWLAVISAVAPVGFQTAAIRFVAASRANAWAGALRGFLIRSFQIVLLGGLVLSGIFLGGAAALKGTIGLDRAEVFYVSAAIIPVLACQGLAQGILKGLRQTAKGVIAYPFFPQIVLSVFLVPVFWGGHRLDALAAIWLYLAASLVAAGITWFWVLRATLPEVRAVSPTFENRKWILTAFPLVLSVGTQMLLRRTDVLLLGVLGSTRDVGIYVVAMSLAQAVLFFQQSSNAILSPLISESFSKNKIKEIQSVTTTTTWAVGLGSAVVLTVMLLVAPYVLAYFGPAFTDGYTVVGILCVGQFFFILAGPASPILAVCGRQNDLAWTLSLACAINIVLNVLLIPDHGMEGAAAATAISIFVWNAISSVCVYSRLQINSTIFSRPTLQRAGGVG